MLPLLPKPTDNSGLSGSVDVKAQMESLERAFEKMDSDGSNAVSQAEFEGFFGGPKRGAKNGSPGKGGGSRTPRRARALHVVAPAGKGGTPAAASASAEQKQSTSPRMPPLSPLLAVMRDGSPNWPQPVLPPGEGRQVFDRMLRKNYTNTWLKPVNLPKPPRFGPPALSTFLAAASPRSPRSLPPMAKSSAAAAAGNRGDGDGGADRGDGGGAGGESGDDGGEGGGDGGEDEGDGEGEGGGGGGGGGGGSEMRLSPNPGSKDDPRFCADLRVESARVAKSKAPLPAVSPRWRPPVVLLATDATTTPRKLTWQVENIVWLRSLTWTEQCGMFYGYVSTYYACTHCDRRSTCVAK